MTALEANYEDHESDYQLHSRPKDQLARASSRYRRPNYGRKKGKGPSQANGMQRRRHKRINW